MLLKSNNRNRQCGTTNFHCSLQWCDSRNKTKMKRYGDVDNKNEVSIVEGRNTQTQKMFTKIASKCRGSDTPTKIMHVCQNTKTNINF
jgi:hypothetical protein